MLAPGGDGPKLGRGVRPVPGDHCLVGKSPKGRQRRKPMLERYEYRVVEARESGDHQRAREGRVGLGGPKASLSPSSAVSGRAIISE
jgi:hypothetical protein